MDENAPSAVAVGGVCVAFVLIGWAVLARVYTPLTIWTCRHPVAAAYDRKDSGALDYLLTGGQCIRILGR